jgi:hypothetical protein
VRLTSPAAGTVLKLGGSVRRSRRWPTLMISGWLLQVVLRLVLVAHQTTPVLIPDESGYLLGARLLSGGAVGDLSGRTFYKAGYSLLIAPAFWLSDDSATVYRIVLAMNSMIGATLVFLAYIALRRFEMPRWHAYVLANVTALLPSMLYYGQFALSDAVLPVLVLGWLLLVHSWIAGRRPLYGVAASIVAAYAYGTHARGLIVLLMHASLLVIVLLWRLAPRRAVAYAAVALVAGGFGSWALNGWVRSEIYPGGAAPLGEWFIHRATSLSGLGWTLSIAVGQIWYTIVASFGVAGVGLLALAALTMSRRTPRPTRVTAGLAVLTVVAIALATSAAVPDEKTVANFAYGRYLCCMSPVLFLAGSALLWHAGRPAATRAVLGATAMAFTAAGVVWLHAGERLSRNFFGPFDFPEICIMTGSWDHLHLWSATVVAILPLTLAMLLLSAYRQRRCLLTVAGAFVAIELAIAAVFTNHVSRYWSEQLNKATSLVPAGLRAQDRVAVSYLGLQWRIWVSQAFQARNGLRPIHPLRRYTLPSDATLVVVPWDVRVPVRKSWPAAPANWRVAATNRSYLGAWVAWRRSE